MTKVGFGVANSMLAEDEEIHFTENILKIQYKAKLELRNIALCKFLNLRHCPVSTISASFLLLL